MFLGGWVDGWIDGWMGVKAVLRIAYSNQKFVNVYQTWRNPQKSFFHNF
jgi:hypothetical protein